MKRVFSFSAFPNLSRRENKFGDPISGPGGSPWRLAPRNRLNDGRAAAATPVVGQSLAKLSGRTHLCSVPTHRFLDSYSSPRMFMTDVGHVN